VSAAFDHTVPPPVVALTGAAGFLGSVLLERLHAGPTAVQTVAVDMQPLRRSIPACVVRQMDIRDAALGALLRQERVTTLVHLAFVVQPIHDTGELYDININGTRNVIAAAVAAGVKKIVFCSSTSVYGFHADTAQPVTEDRPVRPNAANLYAVHKARAEELFSEHRRRFPATVLTVLRPCMILGPHMDNAACRTARALWRIPVPAGCNPALQFVHEDDVIDILARCITVDMPGTFNVVGRGTLDLETFCRLFNKKPLRLWLPLLRSLHRLCWTLRMPGLAFGPDWLDIMRHACIASGARLEREHGWTAAHSSAETLRSHLEACRS
jgi:UDP-glucose 4-epimerase